MTEVAAGALAMLPDEGVPNIGSVGRLVPNMEARLVDDDGKDMPQGENSAGELWLRGPNVMKVWAGILEDPPSDIDPQGYLNNEAATRETITPDGWLKTGDIATRDSKGFFRIVDRKKELIKYKGFQGNQLYPHFLPGESQQSAQSSSRRIRNCASYASRSRGFWFVGVVIDGLELPGCVDPCWTTRRGN